MYKRNFGFSFPLEVNYECSAECILVTFPLSLAQRNSKKVCWCVQNQKKCKNCTLLYSLNSTKTFHRNYPLDSRSDIAVHPEIILHLSNLWTSHLQCIIGTSWNWISVLIQSVLILLLVAHDAIYLRQVFMPEKTSIIACSHPCWIIKLLLCLWALGLFLINCVVCRITVT